MNTDSALAEKLYWHRTALFPSMSLRMFAKMNDEVLSNFVKVTSKQIVKGSDKRKKMLQEIEDWEKENGQDALYWAMKVEFDRELAIVAKMVIDRGNAFDLIRERMVANAEWRWLKSELDKDEEDDEEDF